MAEVADGIVDLRQDIGCMSLYGTLAEFDREFEALVSRAMAPSRSPVDLRSLAIPASIRPSWPGL
jgi:hypothetical protein